MNHPLNNDNHNHHNHNHNNMVPWPMNRSDGGDDAVGQQGQHPAPAVVVPQHGQGNSTMNEYTFEPLPDDVTAASANKAIPSALLLDTASVGSTGGGSTHSRSKSPSSTGSNSKRRSWKKPKDKPKRPLSAYNIFFQHERARIVDGRAGEEFTPDQIVESIEKILAKGRAKRRHRKTHGRISFGDLARAIADAWKLISPKDKAIFEHYAEIEMMKYRKQVKEWKDRKEHINVDSSSAQPPVDSNMLSQSQHQQSQTKFVNAMGHASFSSIDSRGDMSSSFHGSLSNMSSSGHGQQHSMHRGHSGHHRSTIGSLLESLPDETHGQYNNDPQTVLWSRSRGVMDTNFNASFASEASDITHSQRGDHSTRGGSISGRGTGGTGTGGTGTGGGRGSMKAGATGGGGGGGGGDNDQDPSTSSNAGDESENPMKSILERQQQILQEQLRESHNPLLGVPSSSTSGMPPMAPMMHHQQQQQQQQHPMMMGGGMMNPQKQHGGMTMMGMHPNMIPDMHNSINSLQTGSLHGHAGNFGNNPSHNRMEMPLNDEYDNMTARSGHTSAASLNSDAMMMTPAGGSSSHHRRSGGNFNNSFSSMSGGTGPMGMHSGMMNNPMGMGRTTPQMAALLQQQQQQIDFNNHQMMMMQSSSGAVGGGGGGGDPSAHGIVSDYSNSGRNTVMSDMGSGHSRGGGGYSGHSRGGFSGAGGPGGTSGFHRGNLLSPESMAGFDQLSPQAQMQMHQQQLMISPSGSQHTSTSLGRGPASEANLQRLRQHMPSSQSQQQSLGSSNPMNTSTGSNRTETMDVDQSRRGSGFQPQR